MPKSADAVGYWTRKCWGCGRPQMYTRKDHYERAERSGAVCRWCVAISRGQAAARIVFIGERIGILTVRRRVERQNSQAILFEFECECDCGEVRVFLNSSLARVKGGVKSCGCLVGKHKPKPRTGYKDITGKFWAHLKSGARKRGYVVLVTLEQAWNQWVKQNGRCALTGMLLTMTGYGSDAEQTASLDRIDSKGDYTSDNIQWVHRVVNKMKLALSDEEFARWCKLIVDHRPDLWKPKAEPIIDLVA